MSGKRTYSPELHDVVKTPGELADELRNRIERAAPFFATFAPGIEGNANRAKAERYFAEHFAIWAESWLTPIVNQLEVRAGRTPREVRATIARAVQNGEDWQ